MKERAILVIDVRDIKQIKDELERQYEGVQSIMKHDLLAKMKQDKMILLDIRPAEEYETSHIPGAISVPLEHLEEYLKTINKADVELAAYCRGPYCSLTSQAVDYIQKQGFTAYRVKEGAPEWNACDGE
ncbi:rhodanese-like domain-containing protein [Paenibacillus maysiensis]|uniref:rhodanese-like domain-containing protein n=1 Tax=Paenibacillus maysiensis TaxID=1155954 RepID=UPI001FD7615C|nr:rhodanese-like domain-containing protein [Paenibacillus maysiensis]